MSSLVTGKSVMTHYLLTNKDELLAGDYVPLFIYILHTVAIALGFPIGISMRVVEIKYKVGKTVDGWLCISFRTWVVKCT